MLILKRLDYAKQVIERGYYNSTNSILESNVE